MKRKWIGLVAVALVALGIIAYKSHLSRETQSTATYAMTVPAGDAPSQETQSAVLPRVLLVADLREADSDGDACAQIIQDVRAARERGIAVQELSPDSPSDLLSRYHVLTVPTVLRPPGQRDFPIRR
jgi:hypothetical protein